MNVRAAWQHACNFNLRPRLLSRSARVSAEHARHSLHLITSHGQLQTSCAARIRRLRMLHPTDVRSARVDPASCVDISDCCVPPNHGRPLEEGSAPLKEIAPLRLSVQCISRAASRCRNWYYQPGAKPLGRPCTPSDALQARLNRSCWAQTHCIHWCCRAADCMHPTECTLVFARAHVVCASGGSS
jgi:hypothetical protein